MHYDVCIIGGGIVGTATALEIVSTNPGKKVLLIEKETELTRHQSGHSSGVIHAGIYYKPKSLKAELCRTGAAATRDFCQRHRIDFRTPGKLVVATDDAELERLARLSANAAENGIETRDIGAAMLAKLEPAISGREALLVPGTGIVDYRKVVQAMAALVKEAGGEIVLGAPVRAIHESEHHVDVIAGGNRWRAGQVIASAGLQADRMARMAGLKPDFQIVPFRGEYFAIRPERRNIVRHLIYPVPDPALPFLGIHLTPMIDGTLTVGPNAVLGFSREGYRKGSFDLRDVCAYLRFPGLWKALAANARFGISELGDSLSKARYLEKCRKYCPALTLDDLTPYPAGIRAQAVTSSGAFVQDFLFLKSERTLHVCNAPSPAATSAISIARMIVAQLEG